MVKTLTQYCLVLLAITILALPLAAESDESVAQDPGVGISSINFEFLNTAKTSEVALRNFIRLQEGDSFIGISELHAAAETERQRLLNTRYFDSVNLVALPISSGSNKYALLFSIEEGSTFLPIPYPIPDSSVGAGGWSFGLEVQYDNAFGSMTDLVLAANADFAFAEDVHLKGWKIDPLWQNLRLGNTIVNLRYRQEYRTTELSDPSLAENEQLRQHFTNHESFFRLDINVPLAENLVYTISPRIGLKYNFNYHDSFEGSTVQDNSSVIEDRGNFILGHGLEFGNVDWNNRLRSGYNLSAVNNLNFLSSGGADEAGSSFRFTTELELSASVYEQLGGRAYYYGRLRLLGVFLGEKTGLGSYLRAVKNSSMYGNAAVFIQNSVAIDLFKIGPAYIQIHPFIDSGFSTSPSSRKSFAETLRLGVGTELVALVGSTEIRGSLGYDPVSAYLDFGFSTGFSY